MMVDENEMKYSMLHDVPNPEISKVDENAIKYSMHHDVPNPEI